MSITVRGTTGDDPYAIHTNGTDEISSITNQVTDPDGTEWLVLEVQPNNTKAKILMEDLGISGSDPAAYHDNESGEIEATPYIGINNVIVSDLVLLEQESSSFSKKSARVDDVLSVATMDMIQEGILYKKLTRDERDKLGTIAEFADVTDAANVTTALATVPVNAHSDITSPGGDIEDAVTKKHTQGTDVTLGVQTQDIDMGGFKATNAADPIDDQDLVTKIYSDTNTHDHFAIHINVAEEILPISGAVPVPTSVFVMETEASLWGKRSVNFATLESTIDIDNIAEGVTYKKLPATDLPKITGTVDAHSDLTSPGADIEDAVSKRHIQGTDVTLGVQTQNVDLGGFRATNAADPIADQDLATRYYVETSAHDPLAIHVNGVNEIHGLTGVAPVGTSVFAMETEATLWEKRGVDFATLEGAVNIDNITDGTTFKKLPAADLPQITGTVDAHSDITSPGVSIEDAVAKRHTQGTDTTLGVQTQNVDLGGFKAVNSADPVDDQDLVTKSWIDPYIAETEGTVDVHSDILSPGVDIEDAVSKRHVQGTDVTLGVQTQDVDMGGFKIINAGNPDDPQDTTTKSYVDAIIHHDPDAIHVDLASEIEGITPKSDLIGTDLLVVEDSAVIFVKKSTSIADIPLEYIKDGTVYKKFLDAERTKLATIDENADVTADAIGVLPVNSLSDITSPGADIEDAVTKRHTQGTDVTLGVQTQDVDFGTFKGVNAGDPSNPQDLVTKNWIDPYLPPITGTVDVHSDITSPGVNIEDAVSKRHVQGTDVTLGIQSQDVDLGGFKATNAADPVDPQDLVTKSYSDTNIYDPDAIHVDEVDEIHPILGEAPLSTSVFVMETEASLWEKRSVDFAALEGAIIIDNIRDGALYKKLPALDLLKITGAVDVHSDITSPGADIEDAVTKRHTQGTDVTLGVQTQDVDFGTFKGVNAAEPVNPQDLTTKNYVDTSGGNYDPNAVHVDEADEISVLPAGDSVNNNVILAEEPVGKTKIGTTPYLIAAAPNVYNLFDSYAQPVMGDEILAMEDGTTFNKFNFPVENIFFNRDAFLATKPFSSGEYYCAWFNSVNDPVTWQNYHFLHFIRDTVTDDRQLYEITIRIPTNVFHDTNNPYPSVIITNLSDTDTPFLQEILIRSTGANHAQFYFHYSDLTNLEMHFLNLYDATHKMPVEKSGGQSSVPPDLKDRVPVPRPYKTINSNHFKSYFTNSSGTNRLDYRIVTSVGPSGSNEFNFVIPEDFNEFASTYRGGYIALMGIPSLGTANPNKDIDWAVEYDYGVGTGYNDGGAADDGTLYDLTGLAFKIWLLKFQDGLPDIRSPGNHTMGGGFYVKHNGIVGSIEYFGIMLYYR